MLEGVTVVISSSIICVITLYNMLLLLIAAPNSLYVYVRPSNSAY